MPPVFEQNEFRDALLAARAGSTEALGRLLMGCREYLLLVAHEKLDPDMRGKVSPSDVVQESFLEAQRDFRRFQGEREDELLAWLTRILVNNAFNASRRYRATEMRDLAREVPLEGTDSATRAVGQVAAESPSPSKQAMAREQAQAIEQALAQLPEHYRQVIRLRYEQQLGFAEIGLALHCSAEAARKLWARAVDLLQRELNTHDNP